MLDRDVFEDWMAELDAHFPGTRSNRILALYYRALKDRITTDQFEDACVRILRDREFFPPWGEFVPTRSEEDLKAEAVEEWDRVRYAMKRSRHGLPDDVNDITVEVVRSMGGLAELGRMDLSEIRFARNEFMREYVAVGSTPAHREKPAIEDPTVKGMVAGARALRDSKTGD